MSLLSKLRSFHRNKPIGKYMDRWYIVPPEWSLPFCVRLHHIKKGDQTRLPHNHPYSFYSLVLKGWYVEELTPGAAGFQSADHRFRILRKQFCFRKVERRRYHRVVNVPYYGVWTVIFHPRKPKIYEWGFLAKDGTHINRKDYRRPEGF